MHRDTKIFFFYSYADKHPLKEKIRLDLQSMPGVSIWTEEKFRGDKDDNSDLAKEGYSFFKSADYYFTILGKKPDKNVLFDLGYAIALQAANQNLKVIIATVDNSEEVIPALIKDYNALFIDFSEDYAKALECLKENIWSNPSDKIVSFDLQTPLNANSIIVISNKLNEKLINYFSNHPHELRRIDRRLFEEMVAELFDGFGYEVELTQQTRDGGRDIVAIRNEETNIKYLIECKRPDEGNKIGIRPVRELLGVKQDEKATKAILATTSYFSPDALQFFDRNKWELEHKDFNGLMTWIDIYKKKRGIK